MITVPKSEFKKDLVPAGTYVARCYKMIHIGTLTKNFGKGDQEQNVLRIYFELPTELKVFKDGEEPRPLSVDKEYTLVLSEKSNLRKDLKSWRGKDFTQEEADAFDVSRLIGVPCMINIIHTPKKSDPSVFYETIVSISTLPKGFDCPKQINESFEFSVSDFDKEKFDKLPEYFQKEVCKSKEYKALFSENKTEIDTNGVHLDDNGMPF
jgi:hypothetical protein